MKLFITALLCVIAGCASTPTRSVDVPGVPQDLAVEIDMTTQNQQYTSMVLKPSGELWFAGGMTARYGGNRELAATLTADQLRAVWQVIERHNLLDAAGQWFPDEQHVIWQVAIRADGRHNRFKTADDTVAGVSALQDLLFSYQATARYNLPGIGAEGLPQKITR
jgi:hypothetical protein